jgi:dimeric dUTPase (all-alpha-NTP-PPase superfamily)
MSFVQLLLIMLAIYFGYRFIFNFALPVYRASRKVREQFRGMQESMNQNMREQSAREAQQAADKNKPSRPVSKDYIDFEEIK